MQNLIENLSAYIEGQVAHVELGGACSGCLLSPNRLHGWIAGTIRQFFPDIMVEEAPPTG